MINQPPPIHPPQPNSIVVKDKPQSHHSTAKTMILSYNKKKYQLNVSHKYMHTNTLNDTKLYMMIYISNVILNQFTFCEAK